MFEDRYKLASCYDDNTPWMGASLSQRYPQHLICQYLFIHLSEY